MDNPVYYQFEWGGGSKKRGFIYVKTGFMRRSGTSKCVGKITVDRIEFKENIGIQDASFDTIINMFPNNL